MVYGVNNEGVQALKGMASAITSARDEITSNAQKLKSAGEGNNLGPHAESIVSAAETIEQAIRDASEPIEEIAASLNDVAESYEEIIGNDRISAAAGIAAAVIAGGIAGGVAGAAAGGAFSGGGKSGSGGSIPKSTQTLSDVQSWIGSINPNYDPYDYKSPYNVNCGKCALAVFNRLNGSQTATAGVGTLSIPAMNSATGLTQKRMSPDQIRDTLIANGPGSHAVIGVDRAFGSGHWFNAFTPDGQNVYVIDGQSGTISPWPPNYGHVVTWDMSM